MHPSHSRRGVVLAAMAAAMLAATPLASFAQAFPNKPVRLIVPVAPGAAPDLVARLLAERLGALWGQTVIVDNKPGAGGIPGMSALSRSPNDGYTLGFVPAAMATITPLVYKNPQFNIDTDLQPVATVGTSPLLLVTQAGNGIKTLADLARHAKANAGKVNFAAAQPNSLPHLAGEMLNKAGHLGLFTVPYAGPPAAITAVMSGDAALTADGVPSIVQHLKAGKLQALAVTSAKRLPGFDDIPAVAETYPNYEPMIGWFAIFAPTGTAPALQEQVNRDVNRVMQAPDLVARLAELGIYPKTGDVASAHEFFAGQRKLLKNVVAELGLQAQ